ncbi:MAG: hypothetical protein M1405_02655 [Patescibacteria group bacterium]|nr:hypothetical protein [Patescibacteria group bacterium]
MKKVFLSAIFFTLTPILLTFCILYFSFLNVQKRGSFSFLIPDNSVSYAALPGSQNVLGDSISPQDARVAAVADFFNKYHSDLLPFAQNVVSSADKYGLDYRLIPAIAMQESTLCKKAPKDSYNCWGFGIYGKTVTKFNNYPEAIDIVTKTLATQYKQNGLETPQQIMAKYTPSNNGDWANSVSYFMNQLQINL